MPEKVQFRNGSKTEYWYDASGVKHQARWGYSTVNVNIPLGERSQENNNLNGLVTTYYVGNYVYEQGRLKRILTPEGYIETSPTGHMSTMGVWRYNYLLKDHLGNTRQRLRGGTLDENSTVLNTTSATIDYYPFGLEITPEWSSLPGTSTPYLYNGKEIDRMHGANWYDYGARMYDPVLGRWHTVDPLAESYYAWSPYNYTGANPIKRVDVNGEFWGLVIGAAVDYGLQVASNYVEGKTGIEAWTDVNGKSIMASGASGAIGVGIATKVNKVMKVATMAKGMKAAVKVASEVAVDAAASAGNQLITTGNVDLNDVAIDATAGQVVGKTVSKTILGNAQASNSAQVLKRQADRAQRVAAGSRQVRQEAAEMATQKAENYGTSRATAAGAASSRTASTVVKEFEDNNQ